MAADWLDWLNTAVDWGYWTMAGRLLAGGIAMGLGAIGAGVGEGYNAGLALDASSRQPAVAPDLVRTMLIGQAVAETSGIFALVVAIILMFTGVQQACLEVTAASVGAGLAMGLGALGAGVGAGIAGGKAAAGVGRNPGTRGNVIMVMLLGQALATSPAVLALVVSVILAFAQQVNYFTGNNPVLAASALAAGISVGAGAIGPGYGTGLAAAGACDAASRSPDHNDAITRVMLVGGAVSQSTSIYSFVIAVILIFIVRG